MTTRRIIWGRLLAVWFVGFLLIDFLLMPILYYAGGQHPIPFGVSLGMTLAVWFIIQQYTKPYWMETTKSDDDEGGDDNGGAIPG